MEYYKNKKVDISVSSHFRAREAQIAEPGKSRDIRYPGNTHTVGARGVELLNGNNLGGNRNRCRAVFCKRLGHQRANGFIPCREISRDGHSSTGVVEELIGGLNCPVGGAVESQREIRRGGNRPHRSVPGNYVSRGHIRRRCDHNGWCCHSEIQSQEESCNKYVFGLQEEGRLI